MACKWSTTRNKKGPRPARLHYPLRAPDAAPATCTDQPGRDVVLLLAPLDHQLGHLRRGDIAARVGERHASRNARRACTPGGSFGIDYDFRVISRLDIRIVLRTPSPQPVPLSEVFQTVHALGLVGIFVFSSQGSASPARACGQSKNVEL